jgi:hypothetical protein
VFRVFPDSEALLWWGRVEMRLRPGLHPQAPEAGRRGEASDHSVLTPQFADDLAPSIYIQLPVALLHCVHWASGA